MRTLASYQVDFLPNKRNKSHHYLSIFSSQTFFRKWNSLNILRHPIMLIQAKSARKDFKISDFIILDYNNLMSTSGVCKISALIQTQHVCTQKITLLGQTDVIFFHGAGAQIVKHFITTRVDYITKKNCYLRVNLKKYSEKSRIKILILLCLLPSLISVTQDEHL